MTRRYLKYYLAAVFMAGFVFACGAGRAEAQSPTLQVVAKVKEKKKKKPKKVKKIKKKIKIFKTAGDHSDFVWYGKKKRGFLGVHLLKLNEELRAHFGSAKDAGVLVAKVEKDTPAQKAGIQVGDILAEVDGEKVDSIHQVIRLIGKKKDGEQANLKIVRQGKSRTVTATIKERERTQVEVSKFIHKLPGGGEEIEVEVDTGHFEDAMERANEWVEKYHDGEQQIFKFMHKSESEMEQREKEMEQRLKEMEKRLKELEKRLQGKLGKKAHRRTT